MAIASAPPLPKTEPVEAARRAPPPAAPTQSPPEPPRVQATPVPPAAKQAVAPATAAAKAAPGKPLPQDHAARRAEIQMRVSTIEDETYFEVLGVQKEATGEDIRNAYFGLAKRWHPDRTPPELADLKPLVARIFARIGEAYSTLGDAEKRGTYMASLSNPTRARGTAEEEKVVRAVNAALEFQKAEALLRKNDLDGAERHVRLAADADPGQPEYTTLLAWVTALKRGEPKDFNAAGHSQHYDDLIGMLDEVLRGDPRYERALFYRGTLLKRVGREDKAIRDFRLAAELNPKNIDAAREVRLWEKRKRDRGEKDDGGQGLFGKWFKR